MTVGILAYGSLIEDPGVEIEPLIQKKISSVTTPFQIEFARSSRTRGGAPTVVPVDEGGSPVSATILVLNDSISKERAEDLLWRRETRNEGSDKHYSRPTIPKLNTMVVESITSILELDSVLYTKLGSNIANLSEEKLASLAIDSAKSTNVEVGKDGISYLIDLKKQGIITPLMNGYEKAILSSLNVGSLEEAIDICKARK